MASSFTSCAATITSEPRVGAASKIASKIYRQFKQKDHQRYRALTGVAMKLLRAGLKEKEIISKLSRLNKR